MKHAIIALLLFFVQNAAAQEAAIKQSIGTFFEGLHAGDTLKIKSVCHEGMTLQSIKEKEGVGTLTMENLSEFYKSIASLPADVKIEERLLDYTIQVDGAMAHAWTPYEFYVNGKLSHKGVNSFQMLNDNGVWKIIYIVDTRRS